MQVTAEDFRVLREACDALDAVGIPYMVGGGTVVVLWGRNRRTKDFDLFLNREVLAPAMNALSLADFTTTDTEKNWLYKAWRGEVLVDLIVEVRGGVRITDQTLQHARIVEQFGMPFRVMGPEDTLYRKITTFTEGRPDWHDALSIVDRQQGQLDWNYILYLAQRHPQRVLSFLLFARTELHAPHDSPASQVENHLYTGDADGPVPEWVVHHLMREVFYQGTKSPYNPHRLEMKRSA